METHDSKPFLLTKGPLIVSIESLFWQPHRYPKRRVAPETPPLTEVAAPRELNEPWRTGVGRVFRFPLTRRGIVVGYWVPNTDVVLPEEEGDRLIEAIEGTHIPGITATEIRAWAAARKYSWVELLFRYFRLRRLAALVERITASGGEKVSGFLPEEGDEVDLMETVVEWDDDVVIDMEDARSTGMPTAQELLHSIDLEKLPVTHRRQAEFLMSTDSLLRHATEEIQPFKKIQGEDGDQVSYR